MLISVCPNQTQSVTIPPEFNCIPLLVSDTHWYLHWYNTIHSGLHLVLHWWGLTLSTEHSPCSWVWGLGPLLYNVFHASMTTSNIQHWSFTTCQNISIIQRPDLAPYHQDSLLCIEMMGNGVSRTLLGRVGKAIIYNLFLLWIMDEPIWTNMDICSQHQQRANTKVLKYLSVHFGRGERRNFCGRVFGFLITPSRAG